MCYWKLRIPVAEDATTVHGRQYYYFCIPLEIDFWWRVVRPEPPESFIPRVAPDVAWNIRKLATIDQLASELPDELSREIRRSITVNMEQLSQKLGSGVSLVRDVPEAELQAV